MHARGNQYKVGSTPFPNPNSQENIRKARLRSIIQEAEGSRKTAPNGKDKDQDGSTVPPPLPEVRRTHSKILKKPPRKLGES